MSLVPHAFQYFVLKPCCSYVLQESEKRERNVTTNEKIPTIKFRKNPSNILSVKGRIQTVYSRLVLAGLMKTV